LRTESQTSGELLAAQVRRLKVLLAFREGLRHPERVDIRRKTFVAEATSRLEFLIQQHDFVGPEITQDGDYPLVIHVIYHRSDLDVRETLILSYGGEEYVTTDLVHKSAARRTELSAGTAHTGFQMRRALDRHAQALRELFSKQQPDPRPT
jgi:hypothetical protein